MVKTYVILHQREEEDFITDHKCLSVFLRVKLGNFLKTKCSDIEDHGTMKSISFNGNVELMTGNGVCCSVQ